MGVYLQCISNQCYRIELQWFMYFGVNFLYFWKHICKKTWKKLYLQPKNNEFCKINNWQNTTRNDWENGIILLSIQNVCSFSLWKWHGPLLSKSFLWTWFHSKICWWSKVHTNSDSYPKAMLAPYNGLLHTYWGPYDFCIAFYYMGVRAHHMLLLMLFPWEGRNFLRAHPSWN
jgi:hypothetical protein